MRKAVVVVSALFLLFSISTGCNRTDNGNLEINEFPIDAGDLTDTTDTEDTSITESSSDDYAAAEPRHGVEIPKIELPDDTDGAVYDMIGLFVYQGRIYTQAKMYIGDEADAISGLVGERIGYATGNINEWSKQDDYAEEFAGSVAGDIYKVNGYDEWYRLCMTGSYTNDIGEDVPWINFYEHLNGYGMTNGYEIFVISEFFTYAHNEFVSENWSHVKYQDHSNWDYSAPQEYIYKDLTGVTNEDITEFLNDVYFGQLEYLWDENLDASENKYSNGTQQAHLYIHMDDNTIVELRLFEGGYVGYQHLSWCFVKIPGESFDRIFDAIIGE